MNESLILIEKYLAGQLSSEEIKDFESQCQQDPRLAQELKIALQTRYATEYEGDEILRGRLNKQIQKQRTETQRQIRSLKWYGALAAALLLLVVAIPFLSPMGVPLLRPSYIQNILQSLPTLPLWCGRQRLTRKPKSIPWICFGKRQPLPIVRAITSGWIPY